MQKHVVLALALLCAGCSTIIEGRSQEILVNTNPPGASCKLTRKDEALGTISPTPGSLYVEKTKYDILVSCSKKGYETATYINHSGAAGATFGNIVLGGGIG